MKQMLISMNLFGGSQFISIMQFPEAPFISDNCRMLRLLWWQLELELEPAGASGWFVGLFFARLLSWNYLVLLCFSRRSAHKPFAHWWLGWGWWATELNGIHTKMWQSRSSKVMWLRPPCYFWSLVPRDKLSKRVEAPLNIMRCSRLASLSFHRTQEIQWIKHVCGCHGFDFSHFLKQVQTTSWV